MTQYLRSQTTGVVLPYNEKLLKRPNMEVMTAAECATYEASIPARLNGTGEALPDVVAPTVTAEPEPTSVVEEPTSVVEEPTIEVSDLSEGEPTAEELLAALEAD